MNLKSKTDKENLFSLRSRLSRKVPPQHYLRKHKILSQHIIEGRTKSGLVVYRESEITVEQLQDQCNRLKQLISN